MYAFVNMLEFCAECTHIFQRSDMTDDCVFCSLRAATSVPALSLHAACQFCLPACTACPICPSHLLVCGTVGHFYLSTEDQSADIWGIFSIPNNYTTDSPYANYSVHDRNDMDCTDCQCINHERYSRKSGPYSHIGAVFQKLYALYGPYVTYIAEIDS